jgi:hypothetical protein
MICEMLFNLLRIHLSPGAMHLLDQFSIICEMRVAGKASFSYGITNVFAFDDEDEGGGMKLPIHARAADVMAGLQ